MTGVSETALPAEVAVDLYNRGFSIVPVRPGTKRPEIEWRPYQDQRPDISELESWWQDHPERGIAIVCGAISGIVVVDCDDAVAEQWALAHLPATEMRVRTGSGKLHLYYRHPGVVVPPRVKVETGDGHTFNMDVRGDGSIIVTAPTIHPTTGEPYLRDGTWPAVDQLPVYAPTWFSSSTHTSSTGTSTGSDGRVREGGRNDYLYRRGCALRGLGLSEAAITAALQQLNRERCEPPLPDGEVAAAAASACRHQPGADTSTTAPLFRWCSDVELMQRPDLLPLITELLPARALVVLIGMPEAGKTLLLSAVAGAVKTGRALFGAFDVPQPGPVVYVLAEGAEHFKKRIKAWKLHTAFPLDEPYLKMLDGPLNLMEPAHVAAFIEQARAYQPVLVIVDTLARCMPGADENTAQDMGKAIRSLDQIRLELNTAVLVAHHTTKEGSTERGSSALRGACDLMLKVTHDDDLITLQHEKSKDWPAIKPIKFRLVFIPDADSVVIDLAHSNSAAPAGTAKQLQALRVLMELHGGQATTATWLKTAGMADRTFYRVHQTLQDIRAITPGNAITDYGRSLLGSGVPRTATATATATATHCHEDCHE